VLLQAGKAVSNGDARCSVAPARLTAAERLAQLCSRMRVGGLAYDRGRVEMG